MDFENTLRSRPCSTPRILSILRDLEFGFDCSSIPELAFSRLAGAAFDLARRRGARCFGLHAMLISNERDHTDMVNTTLSFVPRTLNTQQTGYHPAA
jgi:diaminopimelate decarboxylase